MILTRNRLYSIVMIACLAGYIWLLFGLVVEPLLDKPIEVCIIKNTTNIPCPSCGSTRAIMALTKGNVIESLSINPIGLLVAFIMLLSPLWVLADIITRKKTLYEFYQIVEKYLDRRKVAIPLIVLVFLLWAWNITRGV